MLTAFMTLPYINQKKAAYLLKWLVQKQDLQKLLKDYLMLDICDLNELAQNTEKSNKKNIKPTTSENDRRFQLVAVCGLSKQQ